MPADESFRAWLDSISDHNGTGTDCADPADDRDILEILYNATDGPNWTNDTNWLTDAPLGNWYGVDTDAAGRVTRLDLSGRWDPNANQAVLHGLSGPIPPELGSLATLEYLSLRYNQLTGTIPSELGNLADLEQLDLTANSLSGTIPHELGNLANLSSLYLNQNDLTGPTPTELGNLANLEVLFLGSNSLSGTIPAELGNLANLSSLYLGSNSLSGTIPRELGNLANLSSLYLNHNDLTGTIPTELGNLANLELLTLRNNNLSGTIPAELGNLANLEALSLRFNSLSGTIPAELGNLVNLGGLYLSNNQLSGTVPPELGNLSSLALLLINHNPLTGPLPLELEGLPLSTFHYNDTRLCVPLEVSFRTWLAGIEDQQGTGVDCGATQTDRDILEILYNATDGPDWTDNTNWLTDAPLEDWYGVDTDAAGRVTRLDLSGRWDPNANQAVLHGLSGPIPPELGSLASLEYLSLRYNQLTETIPSELGNLADLEQLDLAANSLSGTIPPELGNLANLQTLSISGNDLSGSIPTELGNLANLSSLYLGSNSLSGTIPHELGNLANLSSLYLNHNDLTGSIPTELGNLANLELLTLRNNNLSGTIPAELGNLANLEALSLRFNSLSGTIPAELGNLANLGGLYLSNNQLSATVPPELGNLSSLALLLINHNPLTGPLPLELEGLPLSTFHYNDTRLCVPLEVSFRTWLAGIEDQQGTGVDCGATQTDRDILEILYNATDGPDWTDNTNWLTDAPLEDWYGVDTDTAGRVTRLDLSGRYDSEEREWIPHGLSGTIPFELGGLASLQVLDLSWNDLTGSIPAELGNLANLSSLYLNQNDLTGTIPTELGNLASLEYLSLRFNSLSGTIPHELGNLANLSSLYLNQNDLTGTIPTELGNLANLEVLFLGSNSLSGTIPPELGGLDDLFLLSLGSNELSGPIPAELSKFKRLRDLLLFNNTELSGRLPPELGYAEGLEYLGVSGTNLTGPIPRTFSNLELTNFYFDRDGVCVPADLEAWLKTVPEKQEDYTICTDEITVDPATLYFEAPPLGDTARLTAALLTAEGDIVHDATITWSSADTTVARVDSTGLVTSVDYGTTQVTATSDLLTATAEVEIVLTLTDRQVLDSLHQLMGGESWTDTTHWLSDEPLSEWYGVEANEAGKVFGLSLGNNGLAGPMPDLLAELGDLVTLDLSGNALTGEIPWRLGELPQLHSLVLNNNALEGRLPASMGSLAALRYLHIGANELSGVVPRSFRQLALDTLYTAGSGVCVPPSLNEWFAGIGQTDDADLCVASIAIEVVDLPSLTFYAVGEAGTLSATYVNAEGDSTHEASATWSSGDARVVSVDARGRVTAVGEGATEVTATYNSVTGAIPVEVALPENDRDVLGILYDRTRGPGWADGTNWLSDEPLAEWAGVETDEHGRVVALSLSGNNLRGTIHASIGELDQLVTLELSRNWISGSIPAEIGDLGRLRDLALSVNGLSGTLPWELGALDSLRTFNVAATSLSGPVPASFADLELDGFLVGGTQLCVPPSLAAWLSAIEQTDSPPECAASVAIEPSALTFGAVGETARLSVTVVDAEGRVVNSPAVTWESDDPAVAGVDGTGQVTARAAGITAVTATYNSVATGRTGVAVSLPGSDRAALEFLYHATGGDDWKDNTNWLSDKPLEEWYGVGAGNGRVANLDLRNNNLDGEIPAAVGLLDDLFILDLGDNAITGQIPLAIGRLQRLRDLNLRDTELEGPLPPEMGNMTGLAFLSLTDTNLSGPLPETFSKLNVEQFYHSGTGLCVPRSLAAWYETLGNTDPLPCIPETRDRTVLVSLYDETGGPQWQESRNWLSDAGLNTWQGIVTDEEGYVTEIFLPWNGLTDSIPPALGDLARLERLALYGNNLSGRIPPELGKLTRVRRLSLSSNKLEGPIPPEIGGMVSVDTMYLSGNNLSGPIPAEFGNLVNLEHLALFENELSGPLPAEFGKLRKLKSMWMVDNQFEGPLPPELGDMTSLEELSLSGNRITGVLPPELGKLTALKDLSLSDNELTGPIPAEFGNMASLETLFLMRNDLSGSIPPEMGNLANLEVLWLFGNQLTGPVPAEMGNLSKLEEMAIGTNPLTGSIPPELGQMSALEGLFLERTRLTGSIPPELGNLSSLTTLWLFQGDLSGVIPPELGNLSALENLTLSDNQLTGSIPPELGRLSALESLSARGNRFTGRIPPELGQLTSLTRLSFRSNQLSGPLPPELGDLVNLESLDVYNNPDLVGLMPRSMLNLPLGYLNIADTWVCPHLDDEFQEWLNGIPQTDGLWCPPTVTERYALEEFHAAAGGDSWTDNGGWDSDAQVGNWHGVTVNRTDTLVRRLALPDNGLRGSLAPAIANLTKLETLDLGDNSLTGEIPVAMTSMDALDTLRVSGNTDMEGPFPFQMTGMTGLKALQYTNTGMCASPSATFQRWIDGLDVADGATCNNPDAVTLSLPIVYLTQAIQRPRGDVPLLAGREALVRAFLVGDQVNAFFEPEVVATLTRNGEEVHRVVMRTEDDRLRTAADEGVLGTSYNAVVPAEHIVAGTQLVVVADPEEAVPRAPGSQTRFPEVGAMPLNVIDVPPLELTVVPVLYVENPDSSIFAWTDSIADDSPQVGLFRYSFPFSEFSATTRDSYVTSLDLTEENNTWPMVLELEVVYHAEDATGYWYAVADSDEGYVRGVARLNGWVSFGKPWDTELAHEVGHTLDLQHAPCGGALFTDPDFPYSNGSIGMWGYDFRNGSVVSPNSRRDIMGYCYEKGWLSDYYYEKVIRVREEKEGSGARALLAGAGTKSQMLVLWGGVLGDELRIEPVLSMYAAAKLPEQPGPYRLDGIAVDGGTEFSLSFTPGEDQYGNKYFFFAIPIEDDWESSLERIVLTGPEGVVAIDDTDPRSISVFTDPSTGRIRSILRDWDGPLVAAMGATDQLDVQTTRGIREAVTLRPQR